MSIVDRSKQIPCNIHFIEGKLIYENVTDLIIRRLTIPKRFLSDGYSIPKCLRSIISPAELPLRAAIYHDYSYIFNPLNLDRKQVDKDFLSIMLEDKAPKFKAYKAYLGVRLGSWYYWNKWRKRNNNK